RTRLGHPELDQPAAAVGRAGSCRHHRRRRLRDPGAWHPLTDTAMIASAGDGNAPVSPRSERISRLLQHHGALMVLLVLVVVGSVAFDSFATPGNAASIIVSSSFLAIIAIGMTFV